MLMLMLTTVLKLLHFEKSTKCVTETTTKEVLRMVRKTVTISYSCQPETYRKLTALKDSMEAERLDKVNMSAIIDRLINLGFAHREHLKLQAEEKFRQKELPLGQTELANDRRQK